MLDRMFEVRTAVVLLGATLLGCASEARSCDLDTDAIVMWATVTDLGEQVEVEIKFEAAGAEGAALTLCPERDHLEVNGVEASLVRALGHVYYRVEFAGDSVGEYDIVLERDDAQSLSVSVELPPSFTVLEPAANSTHSRGTPLEIVWDPSWPEGLMELAVEDEVGSECIEALGIAYDVEDTGSYMLAAYKLAAGTTGGTCDVTLALTRSVTVEYPAALHEGGEIAGYVRRRQPFTSTE
jgi:hypothetical protein